MAISVDLVCSECSTMRATMLTTAQKEINCPVCGRRIENLSAEDQGEIESVQKKQKMMTIVSIAMFVLCIVFMVLWIGNPDGWKSSDTVAQANSGIFIGAVVCGIAAAVTGALASMKRFTVEF